MFYHSCALANWKFRGGQVLNFWGWGPLKVLGRGHKFFLGGVYPPISPRVPIYALQTKRPQKGPPQKNFKIKIWSNLEILLQKEKTVNLVIPVNLLNCFENCNVWVIKREKLHRFYQEDVWLKKFDYLAGTIAGVGLLSVWPGFHQNSTLFRKYLPALAKSEKKSGGQILRNFELKRCPSAVGKIKSFTNGSGNQNFEIPKFLLDKFSKRQDSWVIL